MPFKRKSQYTLTVLSVLLILVLLFYTARLYHLQVQAGNADDITVGTTTRTAVIKAPRGEILDCYGRQIAINRDGYNLVFNKAYVEENLNDVILSLIRLLSDRGLEWTDKLPLDCTAPFAFTAGESTDKLLKILDLAAYATAENCFVQMTERYDLAGYSDADKRLIMGVRYSMEATDFSIAYPFTLAEDIPTDLMRYIKENNALYTGLSVEVAPFRQYADTSLAVNIIGEVGPIYEEDWDDPAGENYKARGYSYDDKVGKSGIEYYAESDLHGTDGELTYYIDGAGNIVSQKITKEPIAGKTVMLTLDKSIQRTAQDALQNTITALQATGGTVTAGAVVMMNIHSGGVICAANYPTYDSATVHENYQALLDNPYKPLTNRAFQGIYPIGSTIKPIVALAAMTTGNYTLGETINCVHTYRYYSGYQPSCMHYHGVINLNTALAQSCNYFFFELGRRTGATTLTDYFKQFGLGLYTGVEVDDAKGLLLEPEDDASFGGNTLQISIGQLNAFTPLQLANYTATFANGGDHYRATLIDSVVSYDLSVIYSSSEPELVNHIDMNATATAAIKEGMLSVTEDGTGRRSLGDYPIKIGGKTGTSQTDTGADHTIFTVFAPYDNPEISVSVVLEHASSTSSAGAILRTLLDAYFFGTGGDVADTPTYTVLA